MSINEIWNLFKITGNLNYYIKYREMINKGIDKIGDNKS